MFCKKLFWRLDRHNKAVHRVEKKVRAMLAQTNQKLRKKMSTIIQREGNYLYNSDPVLNPNNIIIPARRLRVGKTQRTGNDHIKTNKNDTNEIKENAANENEESVANENKENDAIEKTENDFMALI